MFRVTALLVSVLFVSSAFGAPRRPNVVLIVADDHSADVYGAYGNKQVRTPHLDQLAAEGVRFEHAYANSPMCTSSRQSFLTGRYCHSNGITMLAHVMPESAFTLADRLREAGYRTAAFGKMHFNSSNLHGFERHRTPRQWHQMDRKRANKPLPEGLDVQPQWKPFKDPARIWLNGFYRPFGRYYDEMPGAWYTEECIQFMTEHRDEPFFVQVGYHQPHSPFRFPVEYDKKLNPKDFDVPKPGPEDAGQTPKIFAVLTDEEKQGIRASYYTATQFMDSLAGEVLKAIDDLGLREDTLVIYLGDHGYHLGEHGRFEKHCMFERPVRAPLVVRFPGRVPRDKVNDALVEFVDIVPTVLDYLKIPPSKQQPADQPLQGLSLKPLIEGRVTKLRDAAFSEYQPTEDAMVRTHRYKLIYRTAGPVPNWLGYEPVEVTEGRQVRLYDVQADPEEMHNIAGDPANAQIVSAMLDMLADWYRRTPPIGDPAPEGLSREDFLDWAITARDTYARKPAK